MIGRPFRSLRTGLPTLLALGLLAGCGPDDAWHRLDLARLPPLVDDQPAAEPVVPTLEPLGEGLRRRGLQVTGQVDALRARVGASLSWSLDLGAEPYLSFVPIVPPDDACPPTYVVEASARAAERMELARFAPRPASGLPAVFGRGAIELPLDDLADRRATLVLRTEASCRGGPTDVSWGSPAVWHRRRAPRPPGSPERPNVLLLSIDTLRADHLGAWGADPSETPALDGLAAESDVWTQAFSTFNVTNPSFASISTGLYGKNHGVYDLRTPLPEAHETLAERFQGAGWRTGAVVSVRHLEASQSGLGQGFEDFRSPSSQFAAEAAVDTAIDWIEGQDQRFFYWLHLFDPHTPHTPPRPYAIGERPEAPDAGPIAGWRAMWPRGDLFAFEDRQIGGRHELYRAELAYLDRQIGRLLAVLESRGLLETTVIALVADHGENFGEQGVRFRHAGLWDATLHVPLAVRPPTPPGRQGRRFDGLVQTVDLYPTLLRLAGVAVPDQDGRDLYELSADGRGGRRLVFAETVGRKGAMARDDGFLYTHLVDNAFVEGDRFFFDLVSDPGQRVNLAADAPPSADEARRADLLRQWLADTRGTAAGADAEMQDLEPEAIERLRALGYLAD